MLLSVLQIIPRLDTGGAERTTIDIARAVVAAGGTAHIATSGGRMLDEAKGAGATIHLLDAGAKNPFVIWKNAALLAGIMRMHDICIIHARSRAPAWSALMAARRTGAHFITTYHGIYSGGFPGKRLYNSVMARGEIVIANSAATARHIASVHGVTAPRVTTIPRGTDLSRFDPAAISASRKQAMRDAFSVAAETPIMLHAARLTRWKGQKVAIEALARLKKLWPALNGGAFPALVFAGDAQGRDEYQREMADLAARLGVAGDIRMAGHVDDVPAALAVARVALAPSIEPEAFGRSAVEAQAMGVPVIASKLGAQADTLIDGETGLHVPPDDAASLARAMATLLLADEATHARFALAARKNARTYTVEAMCAATLGVYRSVLEPVP